MEELYGSVFCTIEKNSNEELHTIIWTVPDAVDLCKSETSAVSSEPTYKTFQLMLQAYTDQDCEGLHVYYRAPEPVFLKSLELICFHNWEYISEHEETIFRQLNRTIDDDREWNHLGDLLKTNRDGDQLGFLIGSNEDLVCLLSEKNLRLKFEFVITTKNKTKVNISESQLVNDLGKLFNEGMYSDVVIKSTEGEEFKVHKGVLASRSPILKTQLKLNSTENTNIIKSPVESFVLREVLSFLYTDQSSKVNEIPEKLLEAADYYQLNRLKNLCEEALLEKLSVDNALEILQLADLHSADTLKKLTLEYIEENDVRRRRLKRRRSSNL